MQFAGVHAAGLAQDVIGLGDELHVGILDPVVHHLHVMPGAIRPDVGAAWPAFNLRRDLGEHWRDGVVSRPVAARHHARTAQSAFLAAGNPHPEVVDALRLEFGVPAAGIVKQGIAAIDDDVAGLEVRQQLGDHLVHRPTSLDHQHHPPRPRQHRHQLRDAFRRTHRQVARHALDESLHDACRTVVHRHPNALAGHVADEVLAHHGQPDQTDIALRFHVQPFPKSG